MSSISKIYAAKAAFWKKEKKRCYILTPYAIIYFILLSFYPPAVFPKDPKIQKKMTKQGFFYKCYFFYLWVFKMGIMRLFAF